MRSLVIAILIFCANTLFAQKQILDTNAFKNWNALSPGDPLLSNDGKYIMYRIQNIPLGGSTVVLETTDGSWHEEFKNADNYKITEDSKTAFIKVSENRLAVISLKTRMKKFMPNISSFWLQKYDGGELLGYFKNDGNKELLFKDLKTNIAKSFINVMSWNFDDKSQNLILKQNSKHSISQILSWLNLSTGEALKIWEGHQIEDVIIDTKNNQLVFRTGDSLMHYKQGNIKANLLITYNPPGSGNAITFSRVDRFTKDGESLFVKLTKNEERPKESMVDIWSYLDEFLPTAETRQTLKKEYLGVLSLKNQQISSIQNQGDALFFPKFSSSSDSILLVRSQSTPFWEPWNKESNIGWSLFNCFTGDRKILGFLNNNRTVQFSENGKYLIFYDYKSKNYFSYEISKEKVHNLTKGLNVTWENLDRDDVPSQIELRGVAGWLTSDVGVLVYDQYDIWEIDPSNNERPQNVTNGFGKRNSIIFSLALPENQHGALDLNYNLYLSAFNTLNKDNGFYLKKAGISGDPKLLSMGAYIYNSNKNPYYVPEAADFWPVKATNAELYIVRRMSASQSPNYFSTTNFKEFKQLSNLYPEKAYNWYTSELHSWESLDGRTLQGILYKPENFDPNKKYPVILHYYERKSDGLNGYINPGLLCNGCNINIPTYVSNGYLVFTPDIYYTVGDPMQGTYDAVVSAAKYLSLFPFVNSRKLGIQGCSFGGFQTNYLVTHTNIFKAAVSSAGISNLISGYGSLLDGRSSQDFLENGQIRMGSSLWSLKDRYIKNSPVFNLEAVTTPLLIMHSKNDNGTTSYTDAIQFFTGLRRVGKKSWMLSYSEGNHGIIGLAAKDFSFRMMQFFDHYLKDKPAPIWMTNGISIDSKTVNDNFRYDTKIKTPGLGILTKSEQDKIDSLMNIKRNITTIQ